MYTGNRVLITGGAGFVGSNLAAALIRDGAYVDCVDNLITGRIEAIQPLRCSERFRFLRMDVTSSEFVKTVLGNRYDAVYHLACPTGVPNIEPKGENMARTCSVGTENVLQVACAHNAVLIYASSAEVYGDPEVFPQAEDYCGNVDPVGPRSAYEEGKRFGETLARLYSRACYVDTRIVRIFNTFGIGMSPDDTRVIPHFLKRIREGKKIIIYGDGTQTRTHLYVADLVSALRIVMSEGTSGEVYNVGGESQLTILELVAIMRGLTPLAVEVEHRHHFIEDHAGRLPATEKIRALGWRPRVSISNGLRWMLESLDMPVHASDSEEWRPGTQFAPAESA